MANFGRKKGTLIQFVRDNLIDEASVQIEGARLLMAAAEVGITTTPGSLAISIYNVRREREGKKPIWKRPVIERRVSDLLAQVQDEMTAELGFKLTMAQVVERLISLYREGSCES